MRSALNKIRLTTLRADYERNSITRSAFAQPLGSARVSRAGCGGPTATVFFLKLRYRERLAVTKVRGGEDAIASTRDACATQSCGPSLHSFPEPQGTKNEERVRHDNKHGQILPVFEKICAAQNDRAHERGEK